MTKVKLNKDFLVYIYYILLLAVYLSWSNFDAVPGPIVRLVYLGATLVPVLLWKKNWLAAVILLFYTLAKYSYSSSYLPAENYTYLVAVIFALFFVRSNNRMKIPVSLFLILLVPLFINVFQGGSVEQISFASFMIILLLLSIDKDDEEQFSMLSLIFIVISVVLSVVYLLYGSNFAMSYYDFENERVGFADINYVASIIGFGVMAALHRLMYEPRKKVFKVILYLVVIGIAVITMFSNASRGSLLALGVGIIVLILFSNVSLRSKVLISVLVIGALIVLYKNNYMDLLLYRIEHDDTSGGTGRVDIWKDKWSVYSSSSSILKILCGYGYEGGRRLGTVGGGFAFHNDYLAFLVEYGVLGAIVLLSFLFTPLLKSNKNNRPIVLASLAYLMTVGLTLEPLAAGRLPFYAIWLYAYLATNHDFQRIDKKET